MAKKTAKWERIDNMLTPKGVEELGIGQVLTFDYEGSRTSLRIMCKTKKGAVWAKHIQLYDPDEVEVRA